MALTDNSVPVDALPGEQAEGSALDASAQVEPGGLAAVVGSGDHKVIGRLWITFSLVFGVATFIVAAISAYGQMKDSTFPGVDTEFQFFTVSRIGMVFLFLLPLFIGIATVVCPLQVGASTIAFPRAAAGAFWTWLVGAVVLITAYAVNGGIGGPVLKDGGIAKGVDLAYVGLGVVIVSILLATVCVVTTVITLRTPGMDFFRVPLFSWSMVVAGSVWLITLPVLLGNLVLADLDYHSSGGVLFGQQAAQWRQIAWAFGQPQVFAYAVPALGIMSEIVATFAKARQPQRGVLMGAIGAFGLLSMGAWAQVSFYEDLFNQILFIGISVALGLPLLVLVGGWVAAIRKGALRPSGPFVAGTTAILMLLLGWVGAVLFVIKPFQLHEITTDTPTNLQSFVNTFWSTAYPAAQVGLTGIVVLASAAAAIAGLFYWGTKITGGRVGEGGAFIVGLLMLVASITYGVPFIAFGFATKSPGLDDSLNSFSMISLVGAGIAVVALVVAGLALLNGALSRKGAPDDPWESGQTLEWLTTSPPVKGNFAQLDEVTSPEPVYDLRGEPLAARSEQEGS